MQEEKIPWNEQIKTARKQKGYTLKGMGEKIDCSGRQYQRIEDGLSFEIKRILKICEVLNISIILPNS